MNHCCSVIYNGEEDTHVCFECAYLKDKNSANVIRMEEAGYLDCGDIETEEIRPFLKEYDYSNEILSQCFQKLLKKITREVHPIITLAVNLYHDAEDMERYAKILTDLGSEVGFRKLDVFDESDILMTDRGHEIKVSCKVRGNNLCKKLTEKVEERIGGPMIKNCLDEYQEAAVEYLANESVLKRSEIIEALDYGKGNLVVNLFGFSLLEGKKNNV